MVAVRLSAPGVFGAGNWFIQSHPAVLLSAWAGGLGPGLVATALSTAASGYYFVPPERSLKLHGSELWIGATFAAIGSLITVLVDALRRSHQRALAARQEAEAAEQRYRALVDMTPVPVFVSAGDQIVYANVAMSRLVGASDAQSLLGHSLLTFVDQDSRASVRDRMQQLSSGDVASAPWVEGRWRKSDGTTILAEAAATVVPWHGGQAVQVILLDVTERRAAAEERERLLQSVRQANSAKDEFLATLSHELRTPLNAVLGWAQMLKRGMVPVAEHPKAIETIYRNSELQARLVDDVLDLSRIVSGRLTVRLQPVDLAEIVRGALEAFEGTLAAKRQTLQLDVDSGCTIAADRDRIHQVVWNLLANATKFTGEGGTIAVAVRLASGAVGLTVTDNGIGVDPAFLPRIFHPFTQADSGANRAYGGLGLGLALVQRIVEAHGGTISAHSDGRGTGTRVEVRLPRIASIGAMLQPSADRDEASGAANR